MNLLDLMVKIGVDDQASSKMEGISSAAIAKATVMGNAMYDALKVGVGAAVDGVKSIVGGAMESFASYEQLAGGVEKLYGDASDKLKQYAMEGAKTSGMSMNDYMQQATSFSAALINSLGGDVDKAADQTDKAMRLMSDNVNTFGTDAESVQNAIQGLSRANFTMLDNLKLGYSGSREGMENLIADAEKYAKTVKDMGFDEYAEQMKDTGLSAEELKDRYDELTSSTDLSIDSFSDMVDAIDIIQEKQNIMGTTSREAMKTVEGSIGLVKASWENLLTAFGTGDQNQVQSAVDGIMEGIFGAVNEKTGEVEGGLLNNLLPVVQRVGTSIIGVLPQIAQSIAQSFTQLLSEQLGIDTSWADGLLNGLPEMADKIQQAFADFGEGFSGAFDGEELGSVFEKLMGILGQFFTFLTDNSETIGTVLGTAADVLTKVADVIATVTEALGPFMPAILGAVAAVKGFMVFQEVSAAVTTILPLLTNLGTIIGTFGGPIGAIAAALGGLPVLIIAVVGAIVAFIATNKDAREAIMKAFEAVVGFFQSIPEKLATWWENVKKFVSDKWNSFVEWVTSIPQKITEALGNLKDLLIEAGKSIISGLLKGMKQKAEDMFNWVSGIANKISSLKGPIPYDRKVLIDNGMALMTGLRGGLQSGFERDVMPYVSDMADAMQGALDTTASVRVPVSYDAQPMTVQSAATVTQDRRVYEALQEILGAMPHGVYLNGDALVGQLASPMNMAMGRL